MCRGAPRADGSVCRAAQPTMTPMDFSLALGTEVLSRTPSVLRAMFSDLWRAGLAVAKDPARDRRTKSLGISPTWRSTTGSTGRA
jgi:hypothetical protein